MTVPRSSPNRSQLEQIARRLGRLRNEMVVVGGQVAELLVTDPAATRVRPTDDVDVVVAVTTRAAYHAIGERLRGLGFREDARPGAPLCRWQAPGELVLDVMPISEAILGFSKRTRRFLGHPDGNDTIEGALPDARFDPTLVRRVRQRFEAISRIPGARS